MVSGAASGLGAATARALSQAGVRVVIADMDEEAGPKTARDIEGSQFVRCNVAEAADVEAAVDVASGLGPLRVAVSCAGVGNAARTVSRDGAAHDRDLFKKVVGVNLMGTFHVLSAAAARMATSEPDDGQRGVIVNTASVAAFDGQIGQLAYGSSKAGVVGMTLPAARDLASLGIRVCTIAPGIFDTPMLASLPEDKREALGQSVLCPKRLGQPDEYARLVMHIVDNGYLNGEVIRLDGGIRMPPR